MSWVFREKILEERDGPVKLPGFRERVGAFEPLCRGRASWKRQRPFSR
jgi:hypothetical protein